MLLLVAGMSFQALLYGQGIPDTVSGLHLEHTLNVPSGAQFMDVDEEGNIFLTFPETGFLRKYLQAYDFDSVLSIGGRGGKGESFSFPTQVRVQNRLNTWVLDQGNSRLVILNTNLKVVGTIAFPQTRDPIFPIAFSVFPTGDFIVANSLDNKLYKFDGQGQMRLSFGGLDMGDCNLYGPADLVAGSDGFLTVIDTVEGHLVRFDLFGGCSGLIDIAIPSGIGHIRSFPNGLLFWGSKQVMIRMSAGNQVLATFPPDISKLLAAAAMGSRLYLLFPERVAIYTP